MRATLEIVLTKAISTPILATYSVVEANSTKAAVKGRGNQMAKTYHGLTRSQIMRRAWQLARLNNPTVKTGLRAASQWQTMAWDEARNGNTERWSFLSAEHEARAIERQLTVLTFADRRTPEMQRQMAVLRSDLSALRAGGAL
jgi:anaerobic selenocysteine-containing dehydrogenase